MSKTQRSCRLWKSEGKRKKESGSNFAQKGLVGRVLLRLLLWALLLMRMVQAGDGGLLGHRRGERLVSTCCIAADSAAGVWVIAPRWVGPSLSPHLSGEKSQWHISVDVKPLLYEEDLLLCPALSKLKHFLTPASCSFGSHTLKGYANIFFFTCL